MKRFVQGEDRTQGTLLPELLDDFVSEGNPVRVVDVFVDNLNLAALGFEGIEPEVTGRPSYHPAVLLKIVSVTSAPLLTTAPDWHRKLHR